MSQQQTPPPPPAASEQQQQQEPDKVALYFGRLFYEHLKANDLLLAQNRLRAAPDGAALTEHLSAIGLACATGYRRLRRQNVEHEAAEKQMVDRYIAPPELPDPAGDVVAKEILKQLAEWEKSPAGKAFLSKSRR